MPKQARLIAFYLPQFHPIPENDKAWGKGFTEWTNVTKSTPVFPGHIQPKLPADLGFYDLRVEDTRIQQAEMARAYGIEGFCYWHYWLGNGRRLLERPFQEVLDSGKPDFPFCLGWANHSWEGKGWMGGGEMSIKQEYLGEEDARAHFEFLLKAFSDPRYMRIDGKPILVVYRPNDVPKPYHYFRFWRQLAEQAGLPGLFIIGDTPTKRNSDWGLDGSMYSGQRHLSAEVWDKPTQWDRLHGRAVKKIPYRKVMRHLLKPGGYDAGDYPVIIPGWDTTPRLGTEAMIFYDNDPALFQLHVRQTLDAVRDRKLEENLVFVRAWNEWAEGNYLEPDTQFGLEMLEALKLEVES
tara:strand:+ start:750 stop:1802 length:1053 start_codon:yes stop_codon:yes gene_type:complete